MNGYDFIAQIVGMVVWPALVAYMLYEVAKALRGPDSHA